MNTSSQNPIVQAVVAGTAPQAAKLVAARGLLPLAQDELFEVLVVLRGDAGSEIARAAEETLGAQEPEALLGVASSVGASPTVLDYLARRTSGIGRDVHEAVALNVATPDEAIAALAGATTDGALLELLTVNQQRLIRAPQILEAVLANPARTIEAERRAGEVKREFFEKERGAQQIVEEMRARGMAAAAEFVATAESIGTDSGLTLDDAWLLAQHVEVEDADIDDSWLPLEHLAEFYAESEEQRAASVEQMLAAAGDELGDAATERVALIRRVMLMSVRDRVRLGLKGDREVRAILIRDSNKTVAISVIHNPRITEQEVEAVAAMRTVDSEVLRMISINRAWTRTYPVILNLARNPRAPLPVAISLLPRIHTKDLQSIGQNRNISDAVRRQAQRLVVTRSGK